MIRQYRYWVTFVEAPEEIKRKLESLRVNFGYRTRRVDRNGDPVVSKMFLMHVRAVEVSDTNVLIS